jgi:outer membrane protein assembly factor BamB
MRLTYQKDWRRNILFSLVLSALQVLAVTTLLVFPYPRSVRAAYIDQLSLSKPLVLKWQYATNEMVALTPHIHKDYIVVPFSRGNLISLRLHDGNLVWKAEAGGEITASPLADGQFVYVASTEIPSEDGSGSTSPTGVLRALGYESGVTNWIIKLPLPLRGVLAANDTTIFGCSDDGRTFAIRKVDGQVAWSRKSERAVTTNLLLTADGLFLGSDDGTVSALDQGTGATLWSYRIGGAVSSNLAVIGRTICVGAADNYTYAISSSDGRPLWKRRAGGKVQSVVSTPRGFLITSTDNFTYLLSPLRGTRYWKRLLPGRVSALPVATVDGALFAPLSGEECLVLDLKNGKKLNTVYVGDGNNTSAAPLISGRILVLTTRQGLFALTDVVKP